MSLQPLLEILLRIVGEIGLSHHRQQRLCNRHFVCHRKRRGREKRGHVMKGRWKKRRMDSAGGSAWLDENQFLEPLNLAADAKLLVEVDQVGAAAEQHMLAVVHYFAGTRMFIRRRAPAHIRTALEQRDVKIGTSKRTAGGQPSETCTHNCDFLLSRFRR